VTAMRAPYRAGPGTSGSGHNGPVAPMIRVPSTDRVTLAVHDLGGQGPPLLLCHATGFHGLVWRPVAERLATHFSCWSFDVRAHGDSAKPDGLALHWRGFGDDVLAVVDALGLDRPLGAGHSMGAAALVLAELARPGAFRALHLYEPIVFPADWEGNAERGTELIEGTRRRREVFPSREEALANFAAKPPLDALDPAVLRVYVEHGFADEPDGTVRLKCRPADESEIYSRSREHGAFERLGAVSAPATVAAGGRTTSVTAELAALQARGLGRGRLEVFDDLGHFGPLERPAEVAAAVAATFAGG
jgi:pimeloyl-ACP methyl ester carboxylesterase